MPPPPTPPHNARSLSPNLPGSPASSSSPVPSPAQQQPTPPEPSHLCLWETCDKSYPDPEALYLHLCNDHIGRKSTNNLCLTCKWKDCNTSCAKRDHITSHLRVHTPLKPHVCEICQKSFKRPQDLKKHEKIHTEEHHVQHKHSKAITVSDPEYVSRVRGYDPVRGGAAGMRTGPRGPQPYSTSPMSTSARARRSYHDDGRSFGLLPTPSPELLDGIPDDHLFVDGGSHWDPLRSAEAAAMSGAKRSYDTGFEDFFTDVKKRRVSPTYNSHMAERLNSLAAMTHSHGHGHSRSGSGNFNPTSVNVPIRSEHELAAFNEFMLALGRDVVQPRQAPQAPMDVSPDYFDAATLRALGLSGLPGLPSDLGGSMHHSSYSYDATPRSNSHHSHHPSVAAAYSSGLAAGAASAANAYPSLDELSYPSPVSSRASATHAYTQQQQLYAAQAYARHSPAGHMHGTPPLDMASSPLSNSSHSSTPPAVTPPSARAMLPNALLAGSDTPYDLSAFDMLRPSRAPAAVPRLSPADFSTTKAHNPLILLQNAGDKSSSSAGPRTLEPRLHRTLHRGPPALLTAQSAAQTGGSGPRPASERLAPLLSAGEDGLVLAPLQRRRQSASDSDSASESSGSASSPPSPPTRLPGVRELAGDNQASPALSAASLSSSSGRRAGSEEGELARGVADMSFDERRAHAELIRALLIRVNREFALAHRVREADMDVEESDEEERSVDGRRLLDVERSRDVEMTAA